MPASRPLYLYKFHSVECKVHRIGNLPVRAKKFYRGCDCPIWVTGTTAKGEFVPRQTTGLREWEAAEAYLVDFNKQVATEIVQADKGITLEAATKNFLDAHAETIGEKALGQHRLILERLKTYAAGQGVTFAQDLSYDVCRNFLTYGLANIKGTTKGTYRSKLKVFLAEAYRRKWIKEDVARMIKNVHADHEQAEPYTDAEVNCILTTAEKINGGREGYASNGKLFRLLLGLMLETGLRVSDAIRYNPSMCVKSKTGLWKYTYQPKKQRKDKKKKTHVIFLTETLKLAIDAAEWFSKAKPFEYATIQHHDDDRHERNVYERMQNIGSKCKITDCRPHRLRDTFAVRKLQKGMALDDVSKLLGHSSVAITEKYYAKWTIGREDRLEQVFLASL